MDIIPYNKKIYESIIDNARLYAGPCEYIDWKGLEKIADKQIGGELVFTARDFTLKDAGNILDIFKPKEANAHAHKLRFPWPWRQELAFRFYKI